MLIIDKYTYTYYPVIGEDDCTYVLWDHEDLDYFCIFKRSSRYDVFKENDEFYDEFYHGLELEDKVTEALKKGNYIEAMRLEEKVAQCYKHNPELAARSWEELAEKLYEKKAFGLSRDALDKALEIYSNIQEL